MLQITGSKTANGNCRSTLHCSRPAPASLAGRLNFDVMQQIIRSAKAYVLARASIEDRGLWFGEVLRVCLRVLGDSGAVEIIDEEQASTAGHIASAAIKITSPLSPETGSELLEQMRIACPAEVSIDLIEGATAEDVEIDPKSLTVEHFRREFSVDSQFIFHGESCTRVIHNATGKTARSTAHRSKLVNDEEALALMRALLKAERYAA